MSKCVRKILYLHSNNYDIGGSDLCLLKVVRTLDQSKFHPIVGLTLPTPIVNLYKKAGIPVRIIKMKRIRKSKNPLFLVSYLISIFPTVFRIYCLIRREKIDLVHSNDFQDIYGALAARLAGIPAVQHIRLIMTSPEVLKKVLCTLIAKINHRVIAISDAVAKEMFYWNDNISKKVAIRYDWLDIEKTGQLVDKAKNIRDEFNIPRNAPLIGIIGRLEPWKGQHIFIKAIPEVAKGFREARFIIVGGIVKGRGRERYTQELKDLSERLKIRDKLIFTGYRSDVAAIMSSLDIVVHSSVLPEPFGMVILEAMGVGKPVIATNAGGIPEIVVNGETGILYTPGNTGELAKAIKYLLRNPSIAEKMGKNGRERLRKFFTKEILYPKMEGIYCELLRI